MKQMAVSNVLIVGLQGLVMEIGDDVSWVLSGPGLMPCFQPKMLLLLAPSPHLIVIKVTACIAN